MRSIRDLCPGHHARPYADGEVVVRASEGRRHGGASGMVCCAACQRAPHALSSSGASQGSAATTASSAQRAISAVSVSTTSSAASSPTAPPVDAPSVAAGNSSRGATCGSSAAAHPAGIAPSDSPALAAKPPAKEPQARCASGALATRLVAHRRCIAPIWKPSSVAWFYECTECAAHAHAQVRRPAWRERRTRRIEVWRDGGGRDSACMGAGREGAWAPQRRCAEEEEACSRGRCSMQRAPEKRAATHSARPRSSAGVPADISCGSHLQNNATRRRAQGTVVAGCVRALSISWTRVAGQAAASRAMDEEIASSIRAVHTQQHQAARRGPDRHRPTAAHHRRARGARAVNTAAPRLWRARAKPPPAAAT